MVGGSVVGGAVVAGGAPVGSSASGDAVVTSSSSVVFFGSLVESGSSVIASGGGGAVVFPVKNSYVSCTPLLYGVVVGNSAVVASASSADLLILDEAAMNSVSMLPE